MPNLRPSSLTSFTTFHTFLLSDTLPPAYRSLALKLDLQHWEALGDPRAFSGSQGILDRTSFIGVVHVPNGGGITEPRMRVVCLHRTLVRLEISTDRYLFVSPLSSSHRTNLLAVPPGLLRLCTCGVLMEDNVWLSFVSVGKVACSGTVERHMHRS